MPRRIILRYLLTILCLLLIGAWGWTFTNEAGVKYRYRTEANGVAGKEEWKGESGAILAMGKMHLYYRMIRSEYAVGIWGDGWDVYARGRRDESVMYRLALHPHVFREFILRNGRSRYLNIPFWLMLIVFLPVTLWLWYAWLHDRRNQGRVGFEVEPAGKSGED